MEKYSSIEELLSKVSPEHLETINDLEISSLVLDEKKDYSEIA